MVFMQVEGLMQKRVKRYLLANGVVLIKGK
jgi:hypothetical protein